jgi:acyl-CoA dehydrogenase
MKQNTSSVKKGGNTNKKMSGKTGWRCKECGQIHYGDEPSDNCPFCMFPHASYSEVEPEE